MTLPRTGDPVLPDTTDRPLPSRTARLDEAAPCPAPPDRRLQLERGTTQALAEAASLGEAASKVILAICRTLGWEFGACWTLQPGGDTMVCTATWAQDTPGLQAFRHATLDLKISRDPGGLIRRAWMGGEAVWLHDVSADPSFRRGPLALQAGLRSGFAFPIKAGTRVTGVMEFFSREILQPDEELLDSTRYIGSQVGQFSQRTHAQDQLRDAQLLLRAAFEHAAAGLALLAPDGRWVQVNDALCRMLGYTQDELLQLDMLAVTPPQDQSFAPGPWPGVAGETPGLWDGTVGQGLGATHERRYLRRDGGLIWAAVSVSAVQGPDGRPKHFIAVITDITAQRRAQQLQRLAHSVTRCLAESEDAAAAVQAVTRAVCETEGWVCGEYWGLDSRTGMLGLHNVWSAPDARLDHLFEGSRRMQIAPGMGLAGRTLQSGRPLWITDVDADPHVLHRESATAAGLHAAFLFPVVSGTETQGVLAFWSRDAREPDPALFEAAKAIGSQVGQFLRRKHAEEVLRVSEQRFLDHTIELAAIGVAHLAPDGRFLHASRWLCELLGYARDDLLTFTVQQVCHADDRDLAERRRAGLLAGRVASFHCEQRYLRKDGSTVWVGLSNSLKRSPAGEPEYELSMVQDITARKQADERIRYLATHDGLTALPNRVLFSQLLSHALATARRHQRQLAVLFIDLDRFKIINDTLGHEAGDQLLGIVAQRLKQAVRGSDIVARLGGDEFVVLLEETQSTAGVAVVAQALLPTIVKPMEIGGRECRVTASIGIAMYPADAEDELSLMKNADIAMYHAKEEGRDNFRFYSHAIRPHALEKMALETALRRALEQGEFSLRYQAKVDLGSGAITGVEALLRWHNPELGSVPPAQFIPLAEETGMIVPIGKWVLRTACAQAMAWRGQGLPEIGMAVNLSPRQFNDAGLLQDIADVLKDSGMQPQSLELEITEGMVMHDPQRAVKTLHAIKAMGVRLAIDDFGTGYSSLAQLKRFPIDTLKVDRSFVRDLSTRPEDQAIAAAIIAIGRTLGLTVVAEGVETQEQKTFLQDRECDQMQGYFFSQPVSALQFAALLAAHDPAMHGA